MTDGVTCTVTGLEALKEEIQRLTQKTQERIILGAMAKACSVIRQEAIARAPEWTGEVSQGHPPPGTLKKAIYQARAVLQCTSTQEVWVIGVRQGKKAQATKRGKGTANLDAYYASWVEFGHYARQAKGLKRGQKTANQKAGTVQWIPAHPFMRPAYETKKSEAVQVFQRELLDRMQTELNSYKILGFTK